MPEQKKTLVSQTLGATALGALLAVSTACGENRTQDEAKEGFSLLGSPATPPAFQLGAVGCPAAHCNNKNGDHVNMPAIPARAKLLKTVTAYGGSIFGLGCSSNGSRVACTYGPLPGSTPGVNNLVVYDADGNVIWTAPRFLPGRLNGDAFSSAPLIDQSGQVIAADSKGLVRFSSSGQFQWSGAFPSEGLPISPVSMDDGTLFVARKEGSIVAHDPVTGANLAELSLKLNAADTAGFDTVNTPSTRGKRAYVVTEYRGVDPDFPEVPLARLYAIDVDALNPVRENRLRVAWFYSFRAKSGASPTVIGDRIYFDGMGKHGDVEIPTTFAVQDLGSAPYEVFAKNVLPQKAEASFAPDPRGGLWTYGLGDRFLVRFNQDDGTVMQKIDISALVGQASSVVYGPTSALTMSGTSTRPVLMLAARPVVVDGEIVNPIFSLGVDVTTELKTYFIETGRSQLDTPPGQFPVVKNAAGAFRMFYTTLARGPFVVGVP